MAGTKLVNADLEVQGSIKLTTTPNNTGSILTKHTDGTISVRTPAQIKSDIGANFTAGSGLTLSGTTFSLPVTISGTGSFVQSVAQNTNGITVTLGTPPNTTYTGSNGINVSGTVISPTYGTTVGTIAQGNDSRINNGQTAFEWGDHAGKYWSLSGNNIATLPGTGVQTLFQASINQWFGALYNSGTGSISWFTRANSDNTGFENSHPSLRPAMLDYRNKELRFRRGESAAIGTPINWSDYTLYHSGNLRSDAQNDARYLRLTGGTVTGVIKSPAPVANEDLANKEYVDSKASPFNLIDVTQQSYTDKAINVIAFDNQNNGVTYQEGSIDFGITRGAPHTMGVYAFKQGLNTTASGMASSAFGFQTVATGNYSSAFGRQTTASNAYSSAFGSETIASGQYSSAFGDRSTASGFSSSAFGGRSTASGQYSSAFGNQTTASGHFSSAFGFHTVANEYASLAIGRNSTEGTAQVGWVNGSPIFKVGNGTSQSNRRNAYVLYNDGRSEQIKDMEVTEIGQGFVLKSPDGTRWRITVDNSGNLITTSL